MRWGTKTLIAAAAALLLAVGLAACGSGGDSSSTATEATAQEHSGSQSGATAQSGSSGGSSGNFAPEHHSDSGGGSQQFKVKGGDNSVQEFGSEADTSERDAAAVVLHNFLDARAAGDWPAACSYMTRSTIKSFEELGAQSKRIEDTSCPGVLEKLTSLAVKKAMRDEADQADVGSLRIEGDRGFIIYRGPDNTVLAMPMANEDGVWKVTSLAGTPLS